MSTRLTLVVKGLILIAVPLFFQLAFISLVAKMRREGREAENWAIHTKDVIAQAQACRVRLLSAHGAIQGYILTRDPSFEADLKRSVGLAPGELGDLQELVDDNPGQTQAASVIRAKVAEFMDYMDEGSRLVRDGKMDPAKASERRRLAQEKLEALEHEFDVFVVEEKRLDQERHDRLLQSWATLDGLLWGGVATSVLFTVALSMVFTRNISGRIQSLIDNTGRLAEGKELTPPIAGNDEIARLDHVFHEMAATLNAAAQRERVHSEMLERRAEELAEVNGQLGEKAQENEMFVYSVSHDLRSPLVNLQGFSKELELLGKDFGKLLDRDEVPAEVRQRASAMLSTDMGESIRFIQSAVTRLSGIIDALLRLSRAGRVEYRRQVVQVGPLVERVIAALRGTCVERSATIEVGELPPALGDPTAVEQVFGNLIGNALNYLDKERPGRIEVFQAGREALTERVPDGLVVYAVRDNGLGIADSYKSKVFTAFQRLHGDVAKGEGVGLALVRRMVERHGGRVWFESEAGKGTTFFVAFPAVGADNGGADLRTVDDPSALSAPTKNGSEPSWQPSR